MSDDVPRVLVEGDLRLRLMIIAYKEIQRVKKMPKWIPVRLIHHIPNVDEILRPVDFGRAEDLCEDILTSGYRENEPVFTTPLFPQLQQGRYFLGGNHRGSATRDSGKVLIPSYVLSDKVILRMITLMEGSMTAEPENPMEQRENKLKMFFKAFNLLVVATQLKEPSPKGCTVLEMVSLIRTYLRNDPDFDVYR